MGNRRSTRRLPMEWWDTSLRRWPRIRCARSGVPAISWTPRHFAEEASKCRKLIRPSHRHDRHPRLSGYRGGSPGPTRSLPRPHRWIPRRNSSSIRGRAPGTREGEREAAAAPREDAWNRPAKGSIDPGRDLSHEAAPDHRDERERVPGADAPGVGFLTVDSTHRPVLTRTWVSTPAAGAEPPQPRSAGWPPRWGHR